MLKAKQIQFSHKKHRILKGVDVSLEYGEVLAIVGPNGAGKSTLINILANEIEISDQNKILFNDKNFKEWDFKELALHKAKFSQSNSNDIPLLVKDVVLMGRYPYFNSAPDQSDWDIVFDAMDDFEILHLKDKEYNHLSGGEKQRVHLSRVFAQLKNETEFRLLFLDEPLNNLDVRNQYKVLKKVNQFSKGKNSAIVVLHDLNLAARYADKILLMKNGEVMSYGAPNEVFQQQIISDAYDFPCAICKHPITSDPMIVFGN